MKRPVDWIGLDWIDEHERKAAMRRLLAEEMPKFLARGGQIQRVLGAGPDPFQKQSHYRRGATKKTTGVQVRVSPSGFQIAL